MREPISSNKSPHTRVAIVGGGPSGLALARHLQHLGIDFQVFERHNELGGLWNIRNPISPIYESAHFISSKHTTHFLDFPMPASYPDYPSHSQVCDYLVDFAKSLNLGPQLRLSTGVSNTRRTNEGHWELALDNSTCETFTHLVCASGTNWHAKWPKYPGEFTGTLMHSVDFKNARVFNGERVLVVGGGNSACDIASEGTRFASKISISLRRGYFFIPKHIFGIPTDVFSARSEWMPLKVRQWSFRLLLRLIQGKNEDYGLPAVKHKLLESHPTINSLLLYHLRHGDIGVRPDISHFDGKNVVFRDGRVEEYDRVVFATGYNYEIPYLAKDLLKWSGGRPKLDLNIFHPTLNNLFCLGFLETNGGAFKLFEQMSYLVAKSIQADSNNPTELLKLRRSIQKFRDLSGGVRYVASDRHAGYVNMEKFRDTLDEIPRTMGWAKLQSGYFDTQRSLAPAAKKWAVVSGAAGRIAADICPRLINLGYRIFAYDRNQVALDQLKEQYGNAIETHHCDLLEASEFADLLRVLSERTIDLLVNNVGVVFPGSVTSVSWESIEKQIDINLKSTIRVTQVIARDMQRRQTGKIINIVSQGGLVPLPNSAAYSASKFGLRGFFLALHMELKQHNVEVSSIYPAGVNTPSLKHELASGGSALNLLGRPVSPAEVADAVASAVQNPRVEIDLPGASAFAARFAGVFPSLFCRILSKLDAWLERRRPVRQH